MKINDSRGSIEALKPLQIAEEAYFRKSNLKNKIDILPGPPLSSLWHNLENIDPSDLPIILKIVKMRVALCKFK